MEIKKELQNMVVQIKSHSNRIQVREAMQYVDKYYDKATWAAFSPVKARNPSSGRGSRTKNLGKARPPFYRIPSIGFAYYSRT